MTNETEQSKALTVLRETVRNNKPGSATAAQGSGLRLVNALRTMGWNGQRSLSILEVIQLSAVLICLDVLSQDIAKVKFRMYRKLAGGGKEEVLAKEHPAAALLSYRPNAHMTWYEFWIMSLLHLGLGQNAFMAKRMKNGKIDELIPCMPGRTTILAVDPDNDEARRGFYAYQVDRFSPHERIQLAGLPLVFLPGEFIHIRSRMFDGLSGYSNLDAGAKTFSMATELLDYATRLFSNDGGVRGVFQKPGEQGDALSDEAFEHLRMQLAEAMTNLRRNNQPLVLEEGMTFAAVAMNADQAQSSQARDSAVVDIARTFRMPPHKIMHLINVKYENMETLEKSYVQDSLIPICREIEEKMEVSLLTREEMAEYCFEFDRRAMLLNDQKQLAEVTKVLVQNGGLRMDEFRGAFGFNPLGGEAGQARLMPSTFNVVDDKNKVIIPAGAQPAKDDNGSTGAQPAKPSKPKKDSGEEEDNVLEFPTLAGER